MALVYAKSNGWTQVTNNVTVADSDATYFGDEISVKGVSRVLGEINIESGAVGKWQYTLDDTPESVGGVGLDTRSSSSIGTKTWVDLEHEAVVPADADNEMIDLPLPPEAKGVRPAVTITASGYSGDTTIESVCLLSTDKSDLGFSIGGVGADPS